MFGFTIASLFYRTAPILALVTSELTIANTPNKFLINRGELVIFLPALLLAFTGIIGESLGLGRAFWWIQSSSSKFSWISNYFGPVGIDFVVGILCTTLSQLVLNLTVEPTRSSIDLAQSVSFTKPYRDIESDTEVIDQSDTVSVDSKIATSTTPLRPSIYFLLFIFMISYLPSIDMFHHSHPSTSIPDYTYPPISVACVAPRSSFDRHRKGKDETTLEDYLHETRVVASRGAKIISWNEGAVRLEEGSGKSSEGNRNEGWNGMSKVEREFLMKVALDANQYQVSHNSYIVSILELINFVA